MTIPVTTRSGKGSPLTPAEMDANLLALGRDANISQQGNARFANTAETQAFAATDLAISPATFLTAIGQYFVNYSGANYSGTNPGFYKLPNGPYLQWDGVTRLAGAVTPITFPKPVTSVFFAAVHDTSTGNAWIPKPVFITGSGMSIAADFYQAGNNPTVFTYWAIIGL